LPDGLVEAGEVDRVARGAGRDRQRDGEVGLADSGWAEQGDVVVCGDELQGGEVADLARVQFGLEGEVERVEALVVGSPDSLSAVRNRRPSRRPTSSPRSRSTNSR
jgi:hypothetical protein